MNKTLHIVSFDVPFPPDYGGVIDVYNRAFVLKKNGWKIILHCFEYGRGRTHQTHTIADKVFYYSRQKSVSLLFSRFPFIVVSRVSPLLLKNLLRDEHPVLLEGQHCSFFTDQLQEAGKHVLLRMHNVEHDYYAALARHEKSLFKKWFFTRESEKLRSDLDRLKTVPLLCITEKDTAYFRDNGFTADCLPSNLIEIRETKDVSAEPYALFHGNLSVPENQLAVQKLINEHLQSPIQMSVIIAGKNPPNTLVKAISQTPWELIQNPSTTEMQDLIDGAHIHLLVTSQATGLKLKLLNSLASGKVCVATPEMVDGTNLERFCAIWNEGVSLKSLLQNTQEISAKEREERANFLKENYGENRVLKTIHSLIE